MKRRKAPHVTAHPLAMRLDDDPVSVSVELQLLAAQATEASVRGFENAAAKTRFFSALADHLNDLASRLWAVN